MPADTCWWPRQRHDPEAECRNTTILPPTGVKRLVALRARARVLGTGSAEADALARSRSYGA
jgi:hypothetical protein